jgi:hypothetical protein
MTIRIRTLSALLLGAALALPVAAQSIKPGLWETTTQLSSGNGRMQAALAEMQKQLAAMSPEQRQMMEQMMAKQGVQLSAAGDGAMRVRMCITREMAERAELPIQQHGDCTQRRSPISGGMMTMSFSCQNPRVDGEGEVAFSGNTSYHAKMKVTTYAGNQPDTTTSELTGKWLAADCGNIQPLKMPAQD